MTQSAAREILRRIVPWALGANSSKTKYQTYYKGIRGRIGIDGGVRDYAGAPTTMTRHAFVLKHNNSPLSCHMSYDISNEVHNKIQELITKSKKKVFVFMKGVPNAPSCGYSAAVVQILEAYGVDFDSCDVLGNPDIRQELKIFSDWPTVPQVYMDGDFIGGCDILLQMHQSGELKQLFGDKTGSSSEAGGEPQNVK